MTNLLALEMMEDTDGSTAKPHLVSSGTPLMKGEAALAPQSQPNTPLAKVPALDETKEPAKASVLAPNEDRATEKMETNLECSSDSDVTTKL